MVDLVSKHCVPCEGGIAPMSRVEAEKLLEEIRDWKLVDQGVLKINRKFKFKDFAEALAFVNKIGVIAEAEGHHPDIELGWGKVNVTLYTHAIGGLFENDFIMAAKINKIND